MTALMSFFRKLFSWDEPNPEASYNPVRDEHWLALDREQRAAEREARRVTQIRTDWRDQSIQSRFTGKEDS